ncbi:hypothetical protein [Fluviicola sp.]|uniref:hypothetical protein n=1 Tax=Fluviicola sp. TaxID=1917219 RepID=UPI00260B96D0|nr:hypothetical protein [Fluviicola sp.]
MEEKKHIDKLFHEALNQRSFEIPDAFLEDLNKRLDAEEKKRRVFFWWFAGLLCMTGLSLIIFFSLRSPSFPLPDSQATNYKFSASYAAINPEVSLWKTHLSISADEMAIFATMTEKSDPISNIFAIKPKKQAAEKQSQSGSSVQKHVQEEIGKNEAINKSKIKSTLVSVGKPGSQTSVVLDDLSQTTGKPISDNMASMKPTEVIKDSGAEKPDTTIVSETTKDTTLAVNAADTTSNPLTSSENPGDEKKNKPENQWRTEIQLFGGLGANFINDSHTDKGYLGKITKNQSSILAPSFGIQGNLSYKKLTFGTGLSYSQTGEKYSSEMMKYTFKDSTYSEHIIDTILTFDDSLGIWVPVIHDTTLYYSYQYKQDSTLERTSFKNQYSWISIPIYFGYRFELGKYELIPRIGAQFNFGIAKNKGHFPNADFTGMVEYQAVKFNVSYLIQLEARRNFGRWHIFVNPYFKSMINPAISGDLIRRRYASWGIQFGVGLKL